MIAIELYIFLGGENTALQNLVDGGACQIASGLRIGQGVESLKILVLGLLRLRLRLLLYIVVLAVHGRGLGQNAVQVQGLLKVQLRIAGINISIELMIYLINY